MTLCPHCRGKGRHPLDEAGYGAPERRWIVCECRADDGPDAPSSEAVLRDFIDTLERDMQPIPEVRNNDAGIVNVLHMGKILAPFGYDPRDRRSEAAAVTAANAYKAGWWARGAVVQEAR